MKIKSNKINELYEEWSGEHHTNNSNKQVHDSAECTDFAEYCIKYAVSKQRERYMDLYRIIKQAYHLGRDNGSGRSEKNLNDFIEKFMGAETKKLAQVSYVTDTDVGYYEIGEVEGAFQEEQLKDFIERFGHEKLCSQLGYMQFQIWKAVREINGERDNQDASERQ